jgi:hypothetical protein
MPKAPWKCSQCGTVNEPAATSCRGCGRWPSLFDLQDSTIGEAEVDTRAAAPVYEIDPYEPVTAEPGDAAAPTAEAPASQPPPVARTQTTTRSSRRRRPRSPAQRLLRLVIPIGFLLYFLVSNYLANH